jgi:segregation and condensation protein A
MSINNSSNKTGDYTVQTDSYNGPLDLLLQLIEKAELDISKLSLAQVTKQFLSHLENHINEISTEEISSFLIIASKLIQIKSENLLPEFSPKVEEDQDIGDELVRQLILYKKFKEYSKGLGFIEQTGRSTYLRIAQPPKVESEFDLTGIEIDDLMTAFKVAINRIRPETPLTDVISNPRFTIRQKIESISNFFNNKRKGRFNEFLSSEPSKDEIVITFLALLELVKHHLVHVLQETLFSDIEIELTTKWDQEQISDLEFGEEL